ncbi:MAG TPA: DUF2169 domain-containing protein [Vicinamibacterales bacterium]|nr:DUF2169 domain-containing protein [Vicinamibacterales bacterium]
MSDVNVALTGRSSPAENGGARTVLPGQSPEGDYILSVLVKRSYTIEPGRVCGRAEVDRPLAAGDVYWDHPMNSSVRFESDFFPFKVATDVVLNGTAYAPGGSPTTSCVVALQVNDRRKAISVVGDRFAQYNGGGTPVMSDPEPFFKMDLRYELAYGGTDVYSDLKIPYPYPRNPLGSGFVVKNSAKSLEALPLPNLEEPHAPLTAESLCLDDYAQWETRPVPAGFGWFPKVWRPRAMLAGVLPRDRAVEQALRQTYAQLVPPDQRDAYITNGFRDMDFRFFNGASEGLALPLLQGDETIVTENLRPDGRMSFRLPIDKPAIGLDIGAGVQEPDVVLHTVMIHMDEGLIDLVWRGAVVYEGPDWLPQMRKMDVLVS